MNNDNINYSWKKIINYSFFTNNNIPYDTYWHNHVIWYIKLRAKDFNNFLNNYLYRIGGLNEKIINRNCIILHIIHHYHVSGETSSTNLTLKQEKIMIESKENSLFVTFDNQQKAVSWINIKAKNLLREIQVSNSLADFSEESWMDYRDCLTILCEDDGDWDHAGFVVDKGTVLSSSGYYDIKIAQHTKNYNSWVSSSTNGWENYNNSGRYGRIRV